jgi:hypothetical protein
MKWTLAKDYYPEDWQLGRVIGTTIKFPIMFAPHLICDTSGKTYKIDEIEWMQESNDPVFSLEDMKLCWIMCDELHSERSGHCLPAKFYKEFMKTKYNIDHE